MYWEEMVYLATVRMRWFEPANYNVIIEEVNLRFALRGNTYIDKFRGIWANCYASCLTMP